MKVEEDYKYDTYIPKKFMIGIDQRTNAGFPTMKGPDGWMNLSVFERNCGFLPHKQMSAEKEITKELSQCVREIDNAPTSGFKLKDICRNTYSTVLYSDFKCAVLEDPRGWDVTVDVNQLQSLLEKNGFNVSNGELVGLELMYSWPVCSAGKTPFSLVVVDKHAEEVQDATDELLLAKESVEYIKPSRFEIGKIYSSKTSYAAGFKFMYLGKYDVFSKNLHFAAVTAQNYDDIGKFIADRNDMTSEGKHVFYCIDYAYSGAYAFSNLETGKSPYFIVRSLSKMFETVEEDSSMLEGKTMYNSNKPVTLENIQEDMKRSLLFNKIDFSKTSNSSVEYQVLEDIYANLHSYNDDSFNEHCISMTFPICQRYYSKSNQMYTACSMHFKKFSVKPGSNYNTKSEYYAVCKPVECNSYWHYDDVIYCKYEFKPNDPASKLSAFKKLYEKLQPYVKQYWLCNGEAVPAYQNICLN